MTRASVFVIAVLFAFGCSNSKKAKCEKGFDQMKEFMGAFAKGMDEKMGGKGTKDVDAEMDKMKGEFMEACQKLPDDAVDCVADLSKAMGDPECQKKLDNAGFGMGGKKRHKSMDADDKKDDDKKPEEKKDGDSK
jgi:hypothetical protein